MDTSSTPDTAGVRTKPRKALSGEKFGKAFCRVKRELGSIGHGRGTRRAVLEMTEGYARERVGDRARNTPHGIDFSF